jgi:uncharacterized membrane protein
VADVRPPRWLVLGSFLLALAGTAVSGYLTLDHYTTLAPLACPENATINCVKVTTSSYSTVRGIPVALIGLVYYVLMVVLCSPRMWRVNQPALIRGRIVAATSGVGFILYLIWAELFQINAICLWCTVVHLITLTLFGMLLIGQTLSNARALAVS